MSDPSTDNSQEQAMRQGAAGFLGQVLGLEETPEFLAQDLSPIKRDTNASIYTIQLDSSVGPAAFLVYTYVLDATGGDGHTGKELFDSGLLTLQQAAQRSAPGPRAVAHAESGRYGFILATTPGTYRALTGEPDLNDIVASNADLARSRPGRSRGDIAAEFLATLRTTNDIAGEWLASLQGSTETGMSGQQDVIEFTEEETELALYLLDDQSIADLLQSLNLLVTTAQQRTANALAPEDSSPSA